MNNKRNSIMELKPIDGAKSFYNKAYVQMTQEDNQTIYTLYSYNTAICSCEDDGANFKRLWDGYSQTTMRHVKAFVDMFNRDDLPTTKKEWEDMEVFKYEQ